MLEAAETEIETLAPPRPELAASRIIAGRAIGTIRRATLRAEYPWHEDRARKISGAVRHYLQGKSPEFAAAVAETDPSEPIERRIAAAVASLGEPILRATVAAGLSVETVRAGEAIAPNLAYGSHS